MRLFAILIVPVLLVYAPALYAGSGVTDTLMIDENKMVDGLKGARSMVYRATNELFITEASADRIVSYRISSGDDDIPTEPESSSLPDLYAPDGIALLLDTFIAVISSGSDRVHILDEELEYRHTLSVPGWVPGSESFTPADVTGNDIGEIYILDTESRRIYHFNANGVYLQHFEPEHLEYPVSIEYADESLFVADTGTKNMVVMTERGRNLANIGTFPDLRRVRVYQEKIWVLSGSVIHLFNMYGEHLGNWAMKNNSEKLQDIVVLDEQLFLLTSGSLYYSGVIRK